MQIFKSPEIDPVPDDLPGIHAYVSETLRMTNELWPFAGSIVAPGSMPIRTGLLAERAASDSAERER